MAPMDSERVTGLSLAALLIMTSLAGCTGLASSTPNASISADRLTIDVGETVNFDARDSTTPAPTIIDEYVYCETLGKSGKEPVLVSRELSTERFMEPMCSETI